MKKTITFLGTKRQRIQYSLDDQIYTGDVFAQALRQFLEFDQMLVFVTESARSGVYPVLEALQDERIKPVDIPNGETQDEMWNIFEKLTSQIDEKDEVSFDITHGLRSIPFLVFLAAAFLKSAKQVSIKGIYYGALELRKGSQENPGAAPIIDLSEFVTLLDWLNASEQFVKFGNASELAARLRKTGTEGSLEKAAASLEKVSRSLRLILPDQVMEASHELERSLMNAAQAIKQSARPFSVLSKQVTDSYVAFARPNPRLKQNLLPSLECERQIIRWYLERDLLVQAVTLSREWVISWCMVHAGYVDLYDRNSRESVKNVLGGGANTDPRWWELGQMSQKFDTGKRLFDIPSIRKALDIWPQLTKVRNTLDHAGKSASQRAAESLDKLARQVCKSLDELPLPPESEMSE